MQSAEIYNPAAGIWTATGSMTTGRYLHATLLSDGTALVARGIWFKRLLCRVPRSIEE